LNALACDISEINSQLAEAEEKLAGAEAELHQIEGRDRTARFHELIALIKEHRANVVTHTREAALAAGAVYQLLKEARDLVGTLSSPLYVYIREVETPVRPYEGWDVEYFRVELDRTIIQVLPVMELGHPTSHPMLARNAVTGAAFEKV
jgi:hypothetical protein